ncbi:MAG: hypothetical protein H7Z20_01360 [Bdellovibrio sp.]|nr:hypothetical protein [Methylotenera sp.]
MKLKLILVVMLGLVLSGNVWAETTDSLALDNDLQSAQESTSMTWPMLPGENLNDVACLFYPKSVVMQRLFVNKTLNLNTAKQSHLTAAARFAEPTLLVVPTLKSLSKSVPVKQAAAQKPRTNRLQITTDFESLLKKVPVKFKEEYEFWVSKNELLKQQLAILKQKIVFLESKLNNLTLIWEKTLSPSASKSTTINADANVNTNTNTSTNSVTTDKTAINNNANTAAVNATTTTQGANNVAEVASAVTTATNANTGVVAKETGSVSGKKVFKNLNQKPAANASAPKAELAQASNTLLDYLNTDLAKIALALGALLVLAAFLLKKYRERMFAKMSFVATSMQATLQETIVDFGGYLKPKLPEPDNTPEAKQQAQAAKEVEARLDSTLSEAKLLMSINRHQDAIAHLKLTIESQPKASINHWLYLLEIFRKLNLKDDFEAYAKGLHDIFNVMTPVWYETEISIVVPQSLEEFPHIVEKLCSVWPGELASVYLRGLINDNRGGDRTGFGKAVLNEILLLVAMLDVRKDLK